MRIYYWIYVMFVIIDLSMVFFIEDKKKRTNILCWVIFAVLFGLLALRHQCMGIDLGYWRNTGYFQSFEYIAEQPWREVFTLEYKHYERGFIILNKLISSIFCDRQFLMAVCAFISIAPVVNLIRKKSDYPIFSAIVFMGIPVFMIYFSGLRQGIAIGITMLGIKFIEEKKPIKFILTVLAASQFHSSAITFLIAYPIYHIKLNDIWKTVSLLSIPIVYLARVPLFNILSKILKESAEAEYNGSFLLFLVFVAVYLYLTALNKDDNKEQNGMINLFYVACICQAFSGIYSTAMRVGYYFMPYLIIALPNTLSSINLKKENKIHYILLMGVFILYGYYALSVTTWAMTNPYIFFWE